MKKIIRLTESDLHRIIKESVDRVLNEAFSSQKLAKMAQEHGGIRKGAYGSYGDEEFPIANLTDDMIGDEATVLNNTGISGNAVNFKDGTSVPIINSQQASQMQKNFSDKQMQRGRYGQTGDYYSKYNIAPTEKQRHLQGLRKDLATSKRLKQSNDDKSQRTFKQHWKGFDSEIRPQINQQRQKGVNQRDVLGIRQDI